MKKMLSRTEAVNRLRAVRNGLRKAVRSGYEHRAKQCAACDTPGACCLDEHFVNVKITRLEAEAIVEELKKLGPVKQAAVAVRAADAIERYWLLENYDATYACPLYEPGKGCLVHASAKPLPCIVHACYEDPADLPPDSLLADAETQVIKLNERTYGQRTASGPLPVMISRI
jgi:hypothetical protein